MIRPSTKLMEQFSQLTAATIHEAYGRKGSVNPRLKAICSGMKVSGPALTVQCHPGDNLMLHKAIAEAQPGDVIVADCGGVEMGYWGEVMTQCAMARGVGGLVIDGCVRDGSRLRELRFPVFALGFSIRGTVKETVGTINQPIVFGGVQVSPGDMILGDDDGLVVVAQADLADVIDSSFAREEKEAKLIAELKSGQSTTLELLGLTKLFEAQSS